MPFYLIKRIEVPPFRVAGHLQSAPDETLSFVDVTDEERGAIEDVLSQLRARLGGRSLKIRELRCGVLPSAPTGSEVDGPVYMQLMAFTDQGRFILNGVEHQALAAILQEISRRVVAAQPG